MLLVVVVLSGRRPALPQQRLTPCHLRPRSDAFDRPFRPPVPLPSLHNPHPLASHPQAVDAAVDTLTAYLSLRSTMGAEEGAALTSALAERALCCGRGPVEAKADAAASALLTGGGGELARRGAWLVLAARAGGLENEFSPPESRGGARKATAAAAAPKAVSGCVRAMSAGMKKGAGLAGAGDSRKEVGVAWAWWCVVWCVVGIFMAFQGNGAVWRGRPVLFAPRPTAVVSLCFLLPGVWVAGPIVAQDGHR